jgi:hypothetical protein
MDIARQQPFSPWRAMVDKTQVQKIFGAGKPNVSFGVKPTVERLRVRNGCRLKARHFGNSPRFYALA